MNVDFFSPDMCPPQRHTKNLGNAVISLLKHRENLGNDFELLSHPPQTNFETIETKRKNTNKRVATKFDKLYNKGIQILTPKPSSNLSHQIRYNFTEEFSKTNFNLIEVTCRLISQVETKDSFNLARIGCITFKGKLKAIIDKLLEQCKQELNTKHNQNVIGSYLSATYIGEHKFGSCQWPCNKIQDIMKKKYEKYFSNHSSEKPVCFKKRQIIGQYLVPYIGKTNNNNIDDDDENETFIFDGMFVDGDGNLAGIKKDKIYYNDVYFLDIIDMDACTALMSFSLSHVGITSNHITIYLQNNGKHGIYCTNAMCASDIPNASDYLEQQCYSNISLQKYLETNHKIPRAIFSNEEREEEKTTTTTTTFPPTKKQKLNPRGGGEEEEEREDNNNNNNNNNSDDDDDDNNNNNDDDDDDNDEEEEEEEDDDDDTVKEDYQQKQMRIIAKL